VECINRSLLVRHEHLMRALVELSQIGTTPSSTDGVLPHPPEAFDGMEVMAAVGREAMEAHPALIVVEGRLQLRRSMDPAPVDSPEDVFAGCAEDRPHLLDLLAQLLSVNMGHDLREHL